MNKKVLNTLEFDKITDRLSEFASSYKAKSLAKELEPMTDILKIKEAQGETADALSRLYQSGHISFSGLGDIGASLVRLEVGSTLGMGELIAVSKNLDVALRVKGFSAKRDSALPPDSLSERFDGISPLSPFNNEIKRCIISEEEMADDASPGLKNVRRKIEIVNSRIKEQLDHMVNDAAGRGLLQNNKVTMRNGRYCLPVKNEHRNKVDGLIHDQSSTGSTVFVEPAVIVRYNNELSELLIEERKEIEKVLATLSNEAALYIEELKYDMEVLTELDFIFAKAELAKEMQATEPEFNEERRIKIKKGRHPLIDKKKVVPIDISLGKDYNLLVITGPNTGGKTVSLKTVGLLTLMGQAGLHIPAFDKSELGMFDEIYADIGDEQSIEQSLSTFSSHMINIVDILKTADKNSLVLFDELGAGTDPTEGAALAMAILSNLHERDARVMATTHYSELKVYALTTPGVINASLEFDIETLMPTYRILIGIPGKSNAFAISKKLGLSDEIIADAGNRIDTNDKRFEDVITELNRSRQAIEEEEEKIKQRRLEIEREKAAIENDTEKLAERKESLIADAKKEAAKILSEAKEIADASIKKYNKWGFGGATAREMEEERGKLRQKIDSVSKTDGIKVKESLKNRIGTKPLHIGDTVFVVNMGVKGIVNSLPDAKGNVNVTMGIIKSQVNVKDLAYVEESNDIKIERESKGRSTGGSGISMDKSLSVRIEKNLIGMTTDEARTELEKYLDDAYLAHIPQVRIIHGRGTGALKSMVWNYLKKCRYVKDFRAGEFNEGGNGVAVVTFR